MASYPLWDTCQSITNPHRRGRLIRCWCAMFVGMDILTGFVLIALALALGPFIFFRVAIRTDRTGRPLSRRGWVVVSIIWSGVFIFFCLVAEGGVYIGVIATVFAVLSAVFYVRNT